MAGFRPQQYFLRARVNLDLYYIRNWSLWLDLHVLARTVKVVVLRDGAC